jgi:uncharacterized protein (TIRG00374 family)
MRMALGLALLLLLAGLAVWSVDWATFRAAMVQADWFLLTLACVVVVVICIPFCSLRLWLLYRQLPVPREPLPFWPFTSIYFIASAAHHLLPSPVAEVARTLYVRRRWGYSLGALVAAQLAELIIDGLGMGLEFFALSSQIRLPGSVERGSLGMAIALVLLFGIGGFLLIAYVWGREHPDSELESARATGPMLRFVQKLAIAMHRLRQPKLWLLSLGASVTNDLANTLTFGMVCLAVDVKLSVGVWLIAMVAGRLASILPATPGQFGILEAGLMVTLLPFGVEKSRALAIAVLYHLVHFAPVMLVGLWEFRRQLLLDRAGILALREDRFVTETKNNSLNKVSND